MGKMDVAQMLAHCNVSYEMALEENYPKAKGIKKLMLRWFVKPIIVGEKPYKKNIQLPQILELLTTRFSKLKRSVWQNLFKRLKN
jgi:hypothetical protein